MFKRKSKKTYKLLFVGVGTDPAKIRAAVKDLPIAVLVDTQVSTPLLMDTGIEVEKK